MKYPQLYVLVTEKFSLPSVECLQAWSDSKNPVYVHGVSKPIFAVDIRINQIRKVHGYLHHEFSPNISEALVFSVEEVSTLLQLWLSSVNNEVYWLESAQVAHRLQKNLTKCLLVSSHLHRNTFSLSYSYDAAKNLFDQIIETQSMDLTPLKEVIKEFGILLDFRILDFFLETTRPGAIHCS